MGLDTETACDTSKCPAGQGMHRQHATAVLPSQQASSEAQLEPTDAASKWQPKATPQGHGTLTAATGM